MKCWFTLLTLWQLGLLQVASAANCPDAGVVVVASVFATLAVVFIVLGVVGFLIWKRRRDILKREKPSVSEKGENGKFGYANPAFDRDPETMEGVPRHATYKENASDKFQSSSFVASRDLAKKTWSSLPPTDMPDVRQRKSSLGSLDRNKFEQDENTVEVWLTSQDFIGLGFNIAGSMRDGIFVSQVHNRGPAKESGKFKVGDRIMNVNISFENMVYEDALTILSYASPYPVRVTLQKQVSMPKNRKLSEARTNLNHPLYRSHSVDVLNAQSNKENLFHPKRAASEMRYDKKDSPKVHRVSKGGIESNITEETGAGFGDSDVFEKVVTPPRINAVVHRAHSDGPEKLIFDRAVSIPAETDLPNATVDLNSANLKKRSTGSTGSDGYMEDSSRFSDPFANLTEQDRLDMLRLSYADPDTIPNSSFDNDVPVSPSFAIRGAPVKPERKKKRESATSTPSQSDAEFSGSAPSSPKSVAIDEDLVNAVMMPPTEAPPPVPEYETEAEEDIITPQTKTRKSPTYSDKIQLAPVKVMLDYSDIPADNTSVSNNSSTDIALSENDKTGLPNVTQDIRPVSPDCEPVEEECISATQITNECTVPISSRIFVQNEIMDTVQDDTTVHESIQSNLEPGSISKSEVNEIIEHENCELEKDFLQLDMNLNFDSNSVLFKESFPNRNTKEKENGVAYDISVTELDAMEQKVRFDERKRSEKQNKGGIAFEIRDDFTTGTTRFVKTNSVHRTASYDVRLNSDKSMNYDISSQRPTSFKGEVKNRDENSVLDWSGKRLVRSGSFSEIPQGESDWTAEQNLSEEDALIEQMIKDDAKYPVLKQLTKSNLVTSSKGKSNTDNENDLSESDSRCRSLSESSNDGSSSPGRFYGEPNGNEDDFGTSPEDDLPDKLSPLSDTKSDFISSVNKYVDNDQSFSVNLNSTVGGDEEC